MAALFTLLLAVPLVSLTVQDIDTGAAMYPTLWLLLLFSLFSFLCLALMSFLLLRYALVYMGLPPIKQMVLQFKHLTLWQQFAFYWALFALIWLAAIFTLMAVL